MIITCETCGTSFRLKSSMVKESGSKVRCSKCQHVFIVYPPSVMAESGPAYPAGKSFDDDVSAGRYGAEEKAAPSERESAAFVEGETITDMQALGDIDKQTARMKEGDTISDLEEMIDEDISEMTRSEASGTETLFDEDRPLFIESDEEEISLSDLEVGPGPEIISMEDLEAEAASGEILNFDDLIEKAEAPIIMDETAEIDFEDMTKTTEEEDLFAETTIEEPEEVQFEETTEMEAVSEIDFEDMTKTADDEELFGEEILEPEEAEEPEADLEAFTVVDEEYDTRPLTDDIAAEPEEPEKEMEGGLDTELEDFDLEKEPEEEKPSASAEEDTGEKKKAEPEKEASEESAAGATEDFELDFEDELEKALVEDEEEAEAPLDLDLEEETEKAEAEEADLEEFDLDLEPDLEEAEPVAETADDEDLGLDLELDEEDLDLLESGGDAETVDLDQEEFDLDLDLGPEEETVETVAEGEEEFDLDLEPEGEEVASAEGLDDEFELDLDLEPEGQEAASAEAEEEFDLDLDFEPDEATIGETEIAGAAGGGTAKTEEFDLSEIEDFLEEETPATETMEESAELDLDLSTETEGETLESETEMAESDLDLETMLDEEEETKFGDEKEVSLEAVEEQEAPAEAEYEPKAAAIAAEEAADEFPHRAEPRAVPPISEPTFVRSRKSRVKPVLVTLIALIILGALAYGGYMYFFGPEKGPAVMDQGNLQIEMILNPDYRFVNNETAGELLVVTGDVTNRYDQPRSFIQVKSNLFNPAGQVIRSESVFAGNMISDSDLSSLNLETLKTKLANRRGDDNANVGLSPDQSVPFMVVFGNLPENMEEFNVEVVSSAQE